MISKFFKQHVEIERSENSMEPVAMLELDYYLLESDSDGLDNIEEYKEYGVGIVKKTEGIVDEIRQYGNIYANRDETEELVELLARMTVTPSALPYVLDDLLGM